MRLRIVSFLIILLGVALLALHASVYLNAVSDDMFISLRYAHRFLEGKGLTWNDGERVEGYSNLLWVLLVALGGVFTDNLVAVAQAAGFLCMAGVVVILGMSGARPGRGRSTSLAGLGCVAVPIALFVTSPAVANWAVAGLEQPLVALLLAIAAADSLRVFDGRSGGIAAALCFGLLCVTRPDGALFGAVTVCAVPLLMGGKRASLVFAGRVAAAIAFFYLGQLAFRFWYYHELVPNTALVKLTVTQHYLAYGVRYVGMGALRFAIPILLALLALGGLTAGGERPRKILYLWALAGAWSAYLIVMGGDVNWLWRHFIPLAVLWSFLASELAGWLAFQAPKGLARDLLILAPLLFLSHVLLQVKDIEAVVARSPDNRELNERFPGVGSYRDARAVGEFMRDAFSTLDPLLATDTAGAIPFYAGLRAVDMLGLNDWYIPRHPTAQLGSGWMGHDIGNGAYVLSRRPDLVIFCGYFGGFEPCYHSDRDLLQQRSFRERFVPVKFAVPARPGYTLDMWVLRDSPRIGPNITADRLTVPPYLFSSGVPLSAAFANGRWSLALPKDAKASFSAPVLAAGTWTASIAAEADSPVRLSVEGIGEPDPAAAKEGSGSPHALSFPLTEAKSVSIVLENPSADTVSIGEISVMRAGS